MKKNFLVSICLIASVTSCSFLSGFEPDKNDYVVNVDANKVTLLKGKSKKISATTNDPKGVIAYISENKNIAQVDNEGVITAINVGECKIFAYIDSNSDSKLNKSNEVYSEISVIVVNEATISKEKVVKFVPEDSFYYSMESESFSFNEVVNPIDLNIYNIVTEGEVPYINVNDIPKIFKYTLKPDYDQIYDELSVEEKNNFDNSFLLTKEGSKYKFEFFNQNVSQDYLPTSFNNCYAPLYFDIDNSKVTTNSYAKFISYINSTFNNGIPNDFADIIGIVEESSKTKYIINPVSEVVFDFGKYGINFYTINNKAYIPFYSITPFLAEKTNYYYNGNDAIVSTNVSDPIASYYFSNDDVISSTKDYYKSKLKRNTSLSNVNKIVYTNSSLFDKQDGKNRYINTIMSLDYDTNKYAYRQLYSSDSDTFTQDTLFNTDYEGFNSNGKYATVEESYIGRMIKENNTTIRLEIGDNQDSYRFDSYISKGKNNYGSDTFRENIKSFNIGYLLFYLDYFYGLKDVTINDSFENYFKKTKALISLGDTYYKQEDTLYNHLVNANSPSEYSTVLSYIFANNLGDVHSGLISPNLLGLTNMVDGMNVHLNNASTRITTLDERKSSWASLRRNKLSTQINQMHSALEDDSYDYSFYVEDETAVIQFDRFRGKTYELYHYVNTLDSSVNITLPSGKSPAHHYTSLASQDTFIGIKFAFKEIEKNENIKNVVFDVTNNGGGSIREIPLILSFMSDDPTIYQKDTTDNSIAEYHYLVDLDGNGVAGETSDTYKGKYNFYVLTSNYSFSGASLLSACCKTIGCAKIIGVKSGGGTCPVFYGDDSIGSQYQYSGPSNVMYKLNGQFIHNDDGVVVDYSLDSSYWYDFAKLNDYLKSLN